MGDVAQTKVRLIREAIQDNLPRGRPRSRIISAIAAKRPGIPLWFPALLPAAIFAFLVSATVVSRTNMHVPAIRTTEIHPPAGAQTPTAEHAGGLDHGSPPAPDTLPRPLNRVMFPLSVRKIVIDPGHGGLQQGTASQSGVEEKEITLGIALRLRSLLQNADFEVLMTRETDKTVALDTRADFANNTHADLFVSIHVNSMPLRKLRPMETYFLGPTDDPEATKLVVLENHGSSYSLADYRHLLEKTYLDARREESRKLAKAVQTELYRSVHEINPAIEDRGVKTAPFAVLIRTEMPAILVEVSCLSNEDEVKLLTSNEYQENIAQALLTGIRSYANDLKGSEEKIAKNGPNK